jgi:hypothetical protein
MKIENMFSPDVGFELTDGLQKGERLNIPYCASDLRDYYIGVFLICYPLDIIFDLIGNMGDYLDSAPVVFPAALFTDYRIIDAAGSDIAPLG